jgi:hypothetical protein
LLLCCLCSAGISHANELLYSNGSSLTNAVFISEKDLVEINGSASYSQAAASFVLSGDAKVSAVTWWGASFGMMAGTDNAFEVSLYTIDDGVASEEAFYTFQLTSVSKTSVPGFPGTFEYTAEMEPVVLSANTVYLISIVNDFATPAVLSDYWAWRRNSDGPDGGHFARQSATFPPGSWGSGYTSDLAFQLFGSACLRPGCGKPFFNGWRVILAAGQNN